ncbi:MAG: membrane protein insertion efficiency factor YidD [Candidatus Margulisiibacteriota bacterium]|jgi:hypothetical protein
MKDLLLKLISLYQKYISILLPRSCRFEPSCSEYTRQAVAKYGALSGLHKGLLRLSRCHPWGVGGFDPLQ